ncbi:hypothetical protein F0Z19_2547 [Vibrio cyclitrophicus]|nr:hypothetical protein M565_ctg1P1439 [Vibrio cyclitrophicus FF75]KAA8599422.1 hypothetical protein F0Z19_2547 [Vibrio cyclitrophicus]
MDNQINIDPFLVTLTQQKIIAIDPWGFSKTYTHMKISVVGRSFQ